MILAFLREKIQYPKLIVLGISIVTAYILFQADFFKVYAAILNSHGYVSIFLAGLLFSYGFTAPFAVGFFVSLAPTVDILIAVVIGATGSLLSDLIIFEYIRSSFRDELDRLKMTRLFQILSELFHHHVGDRAKKYLLWTCAGFLIASPLPDEFGVTLVSGFTDINKKTFLAISFACNALGIFAILALA